MDIKRHAAERKEPEVKRLVDDSGASAIEFSLVLPLLLALLMGIIDFGFALNDYIALRQGVRDAAREAIVAEFGDNSSCTITGASTANTETRQLICLTKNRITLVGDDRSRIALQLDTAGYDELEPLVLCGQVQLRSMTGLFGGILDDQVMRTRVQMRTERVNDPTDLVEAQETAFTGGDWSWCVPD